MFNGMKRRAVITLAAGSLLLAACGSSDGGSGSTGADGGTLTVTTGQGAIPQLDPGLATFQWERVLYPLLWDGLTETSADGEVVPGLAESWEPNDDFTEWVFELRADVTFSNDRELTAEDIVWNVERVIDDSNASLAHTYLGSVADVEAVSDSEVRFVLDEPDSVLPRGLTTLRIIAPESAEEINTDPVGTGPFVVTDFVPDQELHVVRNEDYWGEQPGIEGIDIVTTNDTAAAVTALRSGDVQVLWNLPASDAQPLEGDGTIDLLQAEESTQLHYLSVDTSTAPFDDVRARQALSLALDREGSMNVAYSGFGEPALYNELVPQGSWAFDPSVLAEQDANLEQAAELFAEAGVAEGDTLTWWGLAGAYPEWNSEAQLLQENLAEIGITLAIENQETGTWVDKFVPIGQEYPAHIIPNAGGDLNDPAFIYSRLAGGACECNWSSDEFDELYAQGVLSDDEAERAQVYSRMQEIVTDELPIIISLHAPMITAAQSDVSGIWVAPSGDLRLEDAQLGEG